MKANRAEHEDFPLDPAPFYRHDAGMSKRWPHFTRTVTRPLDFAIPPFCAFCSTACTGGLCCDRCAALLPRNETACSRCANPMPTISEAVCGRCQARPPPFQSAVAPLLYEFPVDAAIKALKFRRQLFYLPVFANLLVGAAAQNFTDVDGLVPVPLHHWRHALRGFNQALELCNIVSRRTSMPIVRSVKRVRATKTQSGLSADERRRNLRDAFSLSGRLQLRHPLVIDDVMTTGETCGELSKMLLSAGAEKASVLTIARVRQGD